MTRSVLITNDDGIDSPGLHALASAAATHDLDNPGRGTDRPGQRHRRRTRSRRPQWTFTRRTAPIVRITDIEAQAIPAHPGFIVLAAMTCRLGAAMVGGIHGARAMAVSIAADDHGSILRWHTAAAVTQVVLPGLPEAPAKTVLNINVPNLDRHELAPLRRATLSSDGIAQKVNRFVTNFAGESCNELERADYIKISRRDGPRFRRHITRHRPPPHWSRCASPTTATISDYPCWSQLWAARNVIQSE